VHGFFGERKEMVLSNQSIFLIFGRIAIRPYNQSKFLIKNRPNTNTAAKENGTVQTIIIPNIRANRRSPLRSKFLTKNRPNTNTAAKENPTIQSIKIPYKNTAQTGRKHGFAPTKHRKSPTIHNKTPTIQTKTAIIQYFYTPIHLFSTIIQIFYNTIHY